VDFAGLTITPTNIRSSARFLDAIRNFPTPTDITGARAWFGLINQGARTVFFMMQKYCQCVPKTPACCTNGWELCLDSLVGSRFTHPAESRYDPIEGEALSVVYALHQTRYNVLGCRDLIVATDHKPLLQILNDRSLSDIDNRRLLKGENSRVQDVPGKKNLGPDAASRHPTSQATRLPLPGEPPELDNFYAMVSRHDTLASLYQHATDSDTARDTSTAAAVINTLKSVNTVVT
jgi:hypothetical protein